MTKKKMRTLLFVVLTLIVVFYKTTFISGSNSNEEIGTNKTEWTWDLGFGSIVDIVCEYPKELLDDEKLSLDISIRLIESNHDTQWESIIMNLTLFGHYQSESVKDEIGLLTRGQELSSDWHNEKPDMKVDFEDNILQEVTYAFLDLKFHFSIDPSIVPFNDENVYKDRFVGVIKIIPESGKIGTVFALTFTGSAVFILIIIYLSKKLKQMGFRHRSSEIDIGLGSVTYSREYSKISKKRRLTIKPSISTNFGSTKVKIKKEKLK